jgi:hypothetical protein
MSDANEDRGLSSEWDESMLEWTKPALGESNASLGPPAANWAAELGFICSTSWPSLQCMPQEATAAGSRSST